MIKRPFLLLVACNATFVFGCFGSPQGGAAPPPSTTSDPACQLHSKNEKSPGFPFDIAKFGSDVVPVIATGCGAQGCHGAPTGNSGFTVWANAKPGDCDFAKTFNSLIDKVDLATPDNSRLIAAVNGGVAGHPLTYKADAPELAKLRGFITTAAAAFAADGGGVTAPPGPSPFNATTYQATIQPMLERCATSGCHGTGAGGFTLKAAPAPGSADMTANFVAVSALANLAKPETSLIYVQGTVQHASGTSKTLDPADAPVLLAWIQDAKNNAGANPTATCAPLDKFNVGTFGSEILPILSGQLDLNAVGGRGRGAGCMSTACHGIDRGPGKLSLVGDTGTILQNFACFVNLSSPSSSEILACPTNSPGCRKYPHPGQDILGGADDLNYQRIVGFLFGTKADVSPFDFAFFARRINPIFDDVNSVEGGSRGISCSDNSACHGISVAGQSAPNGSNFPILTNASGIDALTINFVSATQFTTFLNPTESSLFLYPSDEISNTAAHQFATGLHHPGGLDFAPDSDLAKSILLWAAGLRPDGNGFQRNWLVGGDFPATQIADQTFIDETTVEPAIFDNSGGAIIRQWDGAFSNSATVDLNASFPRNATDGRVAYAVSYAINTGSREIRAQLAVTTNNPIRIYIDGALVAQNAASGGATAFLTLKPSGSKAAASRILIKVLQRATDAQFAFTAQLSDAVSNTLLTDATGELVFTLGKNGGL